MSESDLKPKNVLEQFGQIHLAAPIVEAFRGNTFVNSRVVLSHPEESDHSLQVLGRARRYPSTEKHPYLTLGLNDITLPGNRGLSLGLALFFDDIPTLKKIDNPLYLAQAIISPLSRYPFESGSQFNVYNNISGYSILTTPEFMTALTVNIKFNDFFKKSLDKLRDYQLPGSPAIQSSPVNSVVKLNGVIV